ncbi:hypothetical protein JCM16303_001942 [Sporobolomyces ruberrimus]
MKLALYTLATLLLVALAQAADPPALPTSSSVAPASSSPASSASASASASGSQSAAANTTVSSGNATASASTSVSLSLSTSLLTSQVVTVSNGRTITQNTTIASVATQTVATTRNLTQITATPTQLLSITAFAPGQSVSGINLGPGDGYVAAGEQLKIAMGSIGVAAIIGAFALF